MSHCTNLTLMYLKINVNQVSQLSKCLISNGKLSYKLSVRIETFNLIICIKNIHILQSTS